MITHSKEDQPIGILDTGIGGLSVANAIFDLMPNERLIYFADLANLPYGKKTQTQIISYVFGIIDFLLEKNCKAVVMACNTASAAALSAARQAYPDLPIVGMEPAVKPAVRATRSKKIGVLATEGTIGSDRYQSLVERFSEGVEVIENTCAGLAEAIENGTGPSSESRALLQQIILPMSEAGVDTYVLGCTHYPFVQDQILDLAGANSTIIDPAPAVARQLQRVLHKLGLEKTTPREEPHLFYASKETPLFAKSLASFCKADYELVS